MSSNCPSSLVGNGTLIGQLLRDLLWRTTRGVWEGVKFTWVAKEKNQGRKPPSLGGVRTKVGGHAPEVGGEGKQGGTI